MGFRDFLARKPRPLLSELGKAGLQQLLGPWGPDRGKGGATWLAEALWLVLFAGFVGAIMRALYDDSSTECARHSGGSPKSLLRYERRP
jgi:hypothetical protein